MDRTAPAIEAKGKTGRRHINWGKGAAWAVLLLSLLATLSGWLYTRSVVESTQQERLATEGQEIRSAILLRLEAYEQILQGSTALFAAADKVTRTEWRAYVAQLKLGNNYPGIQGVGFSKRILPGDKAAHLRAVRAEGYPDYAIRPPGERPEYTSIIYLEPFDWRNQRAFGYDMFSEPIRHNAMEHARDTGNTAISGKVTLVQETEKDKQAGFLMYLPVYAKGRPIDTVEQRRAALEGYIYAPFRVDDLMRSVLKDKLQRFDIHIYDGKNRSPETLLFDNDQCQRCQESHPGETPLIALKLGLPGRDWTVTVLPIIPLQAPGESRAPLLTLGAGTLISVLLFAIAWTLATRRERALALAREMTAALRESEERYRQMFRNNRSVKLLLDPESGAIVDANPAAAEFYGYAVEQLKTMKISDINALSPKEIQREMELAKAQKRVYFNFPHRLASGRVVDVEVYTGPITYQGKTYLHSIIHDITQRKLAESALRESETRLREIAATLAEGLYVLDRQGLITFTNPEAQHLLGWPVEEMIGRDAHDLFHYQRADGTPFPREECIFLRMVESSEIVREQEDLFWRKDGTPLAVSVTASPLVRNGQVEGVVVAFQDITERQAVRRQLEQTLAEQRAILDSATVGIAYLKQRHFVWINRRMEEMFGYASLELIGRSTQMLYSMPEAFERMGTGAYPVMERGETYTGEHLMLHKDGTLFWCSLSGKLLNTAAPEQGAIWILQDITSRKVAEDSLRQLNETLEQRVKQEVAHNREKDHLLIQQSRLAAMGEMIGNIAHQWRQPLNALGLLLANIKDAWQFGELNEAYLDRSMTEGRRLITSMSSTIDDFRNFFRPDLQKSRFSIAAALDETLLLTAAAFKSNQVTVRLDIAQDAEIIGFPNQYSQALLNILANAKDILKERKIAEGRVSIRLGVENGVARLAIRDNAGGVPPDILEKIFDPYFTTREKGTGIGLYMTKMIIENNIGGHIQVRNTEEGAEFVITTPIAPPAEE